MNSATATRLPNEEQGFTATVDAGRLQQALRLALLVRPSRPSQAALRQVRLTVKPQAVIVQATDLMQDAHSTIPTESCRLVAGESSVCLAPDELRSVLPKSGPVTIRLEQESLHVGNYQVSTQSDEAFPELFQPMAEVVATIERTDLLKVAAAMSKDATRPNLCSCFVESVDGHLRLVTTDGHRLAKVDTTSRYSGRTLLIPRATIDVLLKLKTEHIPLAVAENRVVFPLPGYGTLSAKPVEGEFPDYRFVIPKDPTGYLVVDRQSWANALKRLKGLFKASSQVGVRYEISNEERRLRLCVDVNGLSGTEELPLVQDKAIDVVGEGFGMNLRYTLDALSALDSQTVKLSFSGVVSPFSLQGENGDSGVHVIMPIRI